MDKNVLETNILDLKHQFQIEKIKVSLTLMTVGVLGFIGTFIWYVNRIIFGITISLILVLIALFIYSNAKGKINEIILDIEKLKSK